MAKPTKHYGRWRIRWVDETGARQSAVYDDHKTAVAELRAREHIAAEVRSGARAPTPPKRSFADLVAYWEKNRVPLKRSGRDDLSILKQLRTPFGGIALDDVAGWLEAVDRYAVAKQQLCRKTLSNHLTLLSSLLRLGVELGWIVRLPRIRKPRVRLIARDFSYLRSDHEIARFLSAARHEGPLIFTLYATAVFTGLRAGELAGLQWTDVDLEKRLIVVQRSFDGPTKADDVRYVPIVDALLPILSAWREQHPGKLVFTNRDGAMLGPSARAFQEVFHRVLDRADFPKTTRGRGPCRYIRFHDLRHTFASSWVAKGGNLFRLQAVLGHKTVQMTMRYAHLQPTAFREDYGRFPQLDVNSKNDASSERDRTASDADLPRMPDMAGKEERSDAREAERDTADHVPGACCVDQPADRNPVLTGREKAHPACSARATTRSVRPTGDQRLAR